MQRFSTFRNIIMLAPLALTSLGLACDEERGGDVIPAASPVLDETWEAVDLGVWQKITDDGAQIRNAYGQEGKRSFCNEALLSDFDGLFASNFETQAALEDFCEDIDPTSDLDSFTQEPRIVASICRATFGATCSCSGDCSSGLFGCKCQSTPIEQAI